MSKIIITADVHFGVPGRLQDSLLAVKTIREYAKRADIDTVIILGDLYHDRRSLEIDVIHHTSEFFEDTKNNYDQNWVAFPGNHDMFLRHSWEINSLTQLRTNLTVIDDIKQLLIDDRRFWVVPFITYEKAYMSVLYKIKEQIQPDDILLTHIGIRGAAYNTCFLLKDWGIVQFNDFDFSRIYAGHFHNKQQIGEDIWYPGSPIPFKFDEGDTAHGFYVYDLEEDSHRFINIWKACEKFFPDIIPPPQFLTILDDNLNSQNKIDINNNIVRVALQRDYTSDEKSSIRELLTDLGARSVRWWDIVKKIDEKMELKAPAEYKDLFKSFYSADNSPKKKDLDKSILFQAHSEVVIEGDQLYSVEEIE